jgi:hypothetical protein
VNLRPVRQDEIIIFPAKNIVKVQDRTASKTAVFD